MLFVGETSLGVHEQSAEKIFVHVLSVLDDAWLKLGADSLQSLGEHLVVLAGVVVVFESFVHAVRLDGSRVAKLLNSALLGERSLGCYSLFVHDELPLDQSIFGLLCLVRGIHESVGQSDAFCGAEAGLEFDLAVYAFGHFAKACGQRRVRFGGRKRFELL